MSQVAALAPAPRGDSLLNRWIVNPESNVHICNSTYFSWVKTADACKRLDLCWPQWVHFGSQEHHSTSWNSMESHGTSWNPMEGSGTWRNLLVADK
jgi:hypothetical protein